MRSFTYAVAVVPALAHASPVDAVSLFGETVDLEYANYGTDGTFTGTTLLIAVLACFSIRTWRMARTAGRDQPWDC